MIRAISSSFEGTPRAMALSLTFTLGPALAALAGCHRADTEEVKPAAAKVHVDAVTVAEREVPKTVPLTGVLEADARTDLSANASGRVVRTYVELGDHVKTGALLAQLDSRQAVLTRAEAEANATSAAAQLENAKTDCTRYEGLLAKGAITKQEYDRTMSQCRTQGASDEAARTRVLVAAQTLSDATIRAPFAGVIAARFVNVGDYVQPSSKVVTLLVDDPLRLKLTVPEPSIGSVKAGVAVTFVTVGVPGRTFQATVKFVGREIREATRDLLVEAVADNHDGALVPGMFVTAQVASGTLVLPVVPKSAILAAGDNPTVFAIAGGRLQRRAVQLGPELGDQVAVVDGVAKGDRVVAKPTDKTVDGAEVDAPEAGRAASATE